MTDQWSPGKHLLRGALVLAVGAGGFTIWSFTAAIDGAVVAAGRVAVEARRQAIQHPDGGLVTELHVREGSAVWAGDPILTLDGADLFAQQAVARRELVEALVQQDRLLAEVRDAETVTYRSALFDLGADVAELDGILADETILFEARRATLDQSDAQLVERQVQTRSVISGRERQLNASRRQLTLVQEELAVQESLLEKGLTRKSRVLAILREAARLEGEIGELEAGVAEARSTIAGFEFERLRQRAAFRESAKSELRVLQPREAELRERLRLIETRIGRLVLRAPMSGSVLGLHIHTIGGIVPAGAEIASIVPGDAPLVLSVEIDPGQIDRVHAGQEARVRFPNFNAQTTPEVEGRITTVSADAVADQATGRQFFVAELALAPDALDLLGGVVLQPGMPVETFIRTDSRSPASFLLKPLTDYFTYAMREK